MITDSGLGGLSVCAALARRGGTRLTYVNAWPFEGRGYNDLPTTTERAAVFDRVLACLATLAPDRILIACNTLSILYPRTAFSRETTLPVQGIIEAGVGLFAEAMRAQAESPLLLLGTRTTIESAVHCEALLSLGFPPSRILGVPCHGLAAAIEQDPSGPRVAALLADCAAAVRQAGPAGSPVLVGLCCTHYAYIGARIRAVLEQALARPIALLDPNARLALAVELGGSPEGSVQVLSKVALGEGSRRSIAGLIAGVSSAAARALLDYRHVPDLF